MASDQCQQKDKGGTHLCDLKIGHVGPHGTVLSCGCGWFTGESIIGDYDTVFARWESIKKVPSIPTSLLTITIEETV